MIWLAVALAQDPVPLPQPGVVPSAEDAEPVAEAPAPEPEGPNPGQILGAKNAFPIVYAVLTHPRCMNCHPEGDVPYIGDEGQYHAMGISRTSQESGLPCSTCHAENPLNVPGGPPGAPHWSLPPASQAFENRTEAQLCAQLNDPETTGGRDLETLLEHVSHDKLVLWGWNPGPGRSVPRYSHERFVEAFSTWVRGGGACPDDAQDDVPVESPDPQEPVQAPAVEDTPEE